MSDVERGHCHGCGHFTKQDRKVIEGDERLICRNCTFENAVLHVCHEVGDKVYSFMKCEDCGEHAKPLAK